ncbi:hypothetical protein ACFL9U_01145 [Thermodesulfobacteriota bacterium]
MKEIEVILKTVADGLKTMAQGIGSLADKLDTISKAPTPKKPKATAKAKAAAPAKKKVTPRKKKTPQKGKPASAADTVFAIIGKSKRGVDTATVMKKTGYDRKKVHNIIFKLKKQGKIKAVKKGVYVKT